MRFRFLCFTLLICAASLIRIIGISVPALTIERDQLRRLGRQGNTETQLALGEKMALSEADMYDLELISGVSDTMAGNILADRQQVIAAAENLPSLTRHQAFELIYGVGPKRAKLLASKIDPLK